jgi:HK97 family phage prohead protease
MPMKPHKGESQSDFMARCVPEMMGNNGGTKRPQDQAVAACMTMFREREKQVDCEPDDNESFGDFLDRCMDEGGDADECQMIWLDSRSAKPAVKQNGDGKLVRKLHAEPVVNMEFVLSDETQDRMGDIIVSTGWELEDFKKNPIALFNHNSNFPIGSWSNLHVNDGKLRGRLNLLKEGKSQRVDEIRALIDADILRATSVGFTPIESEPIKSGDPFGGSRFKRQALVETSVVSVPANPNAIAIARSLKISDETLTLAFAKPGSRGALEIVRRSSTGKPAETSRSERTIMSLAQRINDTQTRIVALRDKLTEHLKSVDDSNVSDAELEVTSDLNAKIAQEEKGLGALKEAEKRLITTSDDDNAVNGGVVVTSRASARPFGIAPKKLKAIDYLVRDGVVQLFAHRMRKNIDEVRKTIYGEDEATKAFIEYSAKAASAPAMTSVTGWAAELVQQVIAEFMEPLIGSFVGEGQPIPVRQGLFTSATLTPKKMAVITTWTREIDEHSVPAIEGLLRDAIQQDTAVSIDSVLLDTNPATTVRPPGLLNGVAALTPTAGGGFNALVGDLKALSGALLTGTQGHVRRMAWLMNPQQKLSIALTAAPGAGLFPFKEEIGQNKLLTYDVIDSGTVPLGTVIVIDAADFVSVGGEAPRFEISDQATLHMEDTAPLAIGTPGTPPTVAAPVRSLWQTDSMALRLILPLNWTVRRAGVVAWVSGVTW